MRYGEAERLGSLEIDDEIDFGWLLDRPSARLCPAEDFIDIFGSARCTGLECWEPSEHERPGSHEIARYEARRQPVFRVQAQQCAHRNTEQSVFNDIKCVRLAFEGVKNARNIFCSPDPMWRNFQAEVTSRSLSIAHLPHGCGIVSIKHNCQPAKIRDKLTQEFEPLAGNIGLLVRKIQ